MDWIDGEIAADAGLAGDVDELLDEMRTEQQLALREHSGRPARARKAPWR